jgi:hypothetical protein
MASGTNYLDPRLYYTINVIKLSRGGSHAAGLPIESRAWEPALFALKMLVRLYQQSRQSYLNDIDYTIIA